MTHAPTTTHGPNTQRNLGQRVQRDHPHGGLGEERRKARCKREVAADLVADVAPVHEVPEQPHADVHGHSDAVRDLADALSFVRVLHVVDEVGDEAVASELLLASAKRSEAKLCDEE